VRVPFCLAVSAIAVIALNALAPIQGRVARGVANGWGVKAGFQGGATAASSSDNWLQLWRLNAFCAWLWQLAWKPVAAYLQHQTN